MSSDEPSLNQFSNWSSAAEVDYESSASEAEPADGAKPDSHGRRKKKATPYDQTEGEKRSREELLSRDKYSDRAGEGLKIIKEAFGGGKKKVKGRGR